MKSLGNNKEKWYVEVKKADFEGIGERFHISPVVARLLRNRGMIEDDEISLFLNGTKEDMHDPFLMADMEKGVELMTQYIKERKKIRIIGDYDIDGVCSAYILQKGITLAMRNMLGKNVGKKGQLPELPDVVIPDRIKDGYGLNTRLVTQAGEDGIDVIVTCDNGIAARAQVDYANSLGIHVIITDHHEVPYEETVSGERRYRLPRADAVIDPKREDCPYPYKGICGGVVAYKFVEALLEGLRPKTWEKEERENVLEECFAFSAFATVGDVMELTGENHILVKYGLEALSCCENRGMQALIEQCGLKGKELTPYHVGFILGPCFNASGRLDSAYRVMELLNAHSRREAMEIAAELREINAMRQELTLKGLEEAVEYIESRKLLRDPVLVVYLPNVHESIAGIIAGRLRERYGRPSFVLTPAEGGIKGSGRSIDAYNMYEEMTKVRDLFVKYGGHKLAAGLTLSPGCAGEFATKINLNCTLTEEDFIQRVMIDVPMPVDYVTQELLEEMKLLEPYGTGNRRPLFAQKGVLFKRGRIFGKNGNVVKGKIKSPMGASFDAVYFGEGEEFLQNVERCKGMMDIVYTPSENTYRGETTIQIEIKYVQFEEEEEI